MFLRYYYSRLIDRLKKMTKWFFKVIKIILPHLGLTIFIAGYIFMGAAIFQAIETDYDLQLLKEKAKKVVDRYEAIAEEVVSMCVDVENRPDQEGWKEELYSSLSLISEAHEGRPYKVNAKEPYNFKDIIKPRWAYIDGFLYSLSILTTTGIFLS